MPSLEAAQGLCELTPSDDHTPRPSTSALSSHLTITVTSLFSKAQRSWAVFPGPHSWSSSSLCIFCSCPTQKWRLPLAQGPSLGAVHAAELDCVKCETFL